MADIPDSRTLAEVAGAHLRQVRAQYEDLPYPPRDPEAERTRLIHRTADNLICLNHHCFGGARDFRQGFRVLVAGGGTGDSTIFLAEQLRDFGAEVVHLDFSAASLAVAQGRARTRNLQNVRWVHASLLQLPELGLGRFDYINCTGVLHHLESAEAGLAALQSVLGEGGVILLMLYGRYGRQSVYDMQALLRCYLPEGADRQEKIRMTRRLLGALPPTNAFARDLDRWRGEIAAEGLGDAGLYDLLLHSRDRCFDVPAVHALAAGAGLDILAFVDRMTDYRPATHLPDPAFTRHLAGLEEARAQAVAELLVGDLSAHECYLGQRTLNPSASLDDEANALVLMGKTHGRHREIGAALGSGQPVTFSGRSGTMTVAANLVNSLLFARMDGLTPLAQIHAGIRARLPGVAPTVLSEGLRTLLEQLISMGHVCLLKAGSYGVGVPDYSRLPPPASGQGDKAPLPR